MIMKVNDTINFYKQKRLFQIVKRVLDRLGYISWNRTIIFLRMDLNDFQYCLNEPFSFTIASKEDVKNEEGYDDYWFQKEAAIKRIEKGNRLFVFKKNNKMVYFLWAETNCATIGYFDLHFNIPKDLAYISGISTSPEYRKRGIAFRLKKQICEYLKREGYSQLIEVVDPENKTAINIDKKLGFKEYQIAHYIRYWPIRYLVINKYNSNQSKTYISLSKTPRSIWKKFL